MLLKLSIKNHTLDINVHFIFFKHIVFEFYGNLWPSVGLYFPKWSLKEN